MFVQETPGGHHSSHAPQPPQTDKICIIIVVSTTCQHHKLRRQQVDIIVVMHLKLKICLYCICSIRRHGYYLFHHAILCGFYLRVTTNRERHLLNSVLSISSHSQTQLRCLIEQIQYVCVQVRQWSQLEHWHLRFSTIACADVYF